VEAQVNQHRTIDPRQLPTLTLAYLGDAVYELFIRQRLLEKGILRPGQLHKAAVGYVRARAQSQALATLEGNLSPDEAEVARRGRNAKSNAARRGADPKEYAQATAFECLIGYLHLEGRAERLQELLEVAAQQLDALLPPPRPPKSH
jgi:ribonuclease-3 family protein